MESLKLRIDMRNNLYFGKFKYKAVFNIQNVWATRYAEYWVNADPKSIIAKRVQSADAKNLKQLVKFAEWRVKLLELERKEYRWSTGLHKFSLYSNNLEVLENASKHAKISIVYQAQIVDPATEKAVMFFKRVPAFKYRTYFNFNNWGTEYDDIFKYLQSLQHTLVQEGKIAFCPSIKKAILPDANNMTLFGKSNFVDHNDPGFTTILRLMYPKYVHREFELKLCPSVHESKSLQLPLE